MGDGRGGHFLKIPSRGNIVIAQLGDEALDLIVRPYFREGLQNPSHGNGLSGDPQPLAGGIFPNKTAKLRVDSLTPPPPQKK